MNKKVGIVVLNYKNYEDTIGCLHSLLEITYKNTEIVIIDNDSQNESLEHIQKDLLSRQISNVIITEDEIAEAKEICEKIILIQSLSNRGYASGNNLGIRVAMKRRVDYILILNNDTEVTQGFLEPLVKYANSHALVGAVGPKVLKVDGFIDSTCARRRITVSGYFFMGSIVSRLFPNNRWIQRYTYKGEYFFDIPKEVDVLSGCCMMIKRSVIEKIGLLDENTFLYLEEFIIHEKFRNIGLVSVVVPDSQIIHKHGKSTAKQNSEFIRRTAEDSRRYYLREYRHYNRFYVELILLIISNPVESFLSKLFGKKKHDT